MTLQRNGTNSSVRRGLTLCLAAACSLSYADTQYLALFVKGHQIGYSTYSSQPANVNGQRLSISSSTVHLDTGLMGQRMHIITDTTMWTTPIGAPLKLIYNENSGGRNNHLVANFTRT
jgi:hypothetical protein